MCNCKLLYVSISFEAIVINHMNCVGGGGVTLTENGPAEDPDLLATNRCFHNDKNNFLSVPKLFQWSYRHCIIPNIPAHRKFMIPQKTCQLAAPT
jgi:hypothetical protein